MKKKLKQQNVCRKEENDKRGNCKGFRFAIEYSEMMWSRY